MASQGVPDMDLIRSHTPAATTGETDRLARRDLLILRLEVVRQRRRMIRQAAARTRPGQLARLSG
jgi:hypothetical protein